MRPRLLIVDDQRDVLTALRMALAKEGIEVVTAGSPAGALAAVTTDSFDAALIDLNYTRDTTSGVEGLNLLETLHQSDPLLPVIVMTAWASVDLAVQAMRTGARDFIEKPWDNARLLSVVRNQLELGRGLRMGRRFEAENGLWGNASSVQMVLNRRRCRRCSRSHNAWHPPMRRFCSWERAAPARVSWRASFMSGPLVETR